MDQKNEDITIKETRDALIRNTENIIQFQRNTVDIFFKIRNLYSTLEDEIEIMLLPSLSSESENSDSRVRRIIEEINKEGLPINLIKGIIDIDYFFSNSIKIIENLYNQDIQKFRNDPNKVELQKEWKSLFKVYFESIELINEYSPSIKGIKEKIEDLRSRLKVTLNIALDEKKLSPNTVELVEDLIQKLNGLNK